ncbi:glycosyltransferase [Cupriavidus basilensis]
MRVIVATSPNYLETSDVLKRHRDRVQTIPIGLDPAQCTSDEERVACWRERLGSGFFLFIGAIRYYKGLHILMEAARNAAFRVVILGAGPQERALKKQAGELGLCNVTFSARCPMLTNMPCWSCVAASCFPPTFAPRYIRRDAAGGRHVWSAAGVFCRDRHGQQLREYRRPHRPCSATQRPGCASGRAASPARRPRPCRRAGTECARALCPSGSRASTMRGRYQQLYESVLEEGPRWMPLTIWRYRVSEIHGREVGLHGTLARTLAGSALHQHRP